MKEQFIITANGEANAQLGSCNKLKAVIQWGPGYVDGVSTLKGEQPAKCKIIGNWLGGQKVILSNGDCQNFDCVWNFGYTG
jgi:hypothetical protein